MNVQLSSVCITAASWWPTTGSIGMDVCLHDQQADCPCLLAHWQCALSQMSLECLSGIQILRSYCFGRSTHVTDVKVGQWCLWWKHNRLHTMKHVKKSSIMYIRHTSKYLYQCTHYAFQKALGPLLLQNEQCTLWFHPKPDKYFATTWPNWKAVWLLYRTWQWLVIAFDGPPLTVVHM